MSYLRSLTLLLLLANLFFWSWHSHLLGNSSDIIGHEPQRAQMQKSADKIQLSGSQRTTN